MKAINIEWDVDYKEDLACLPTEIEIPEEIADDEHNRPKNNLHISLPYRPSAASEQTARS